MFDTCFKSCDLSFIYCWCNDPETKSQNVESTVYLYNDPEMELWFQRHCRTWGYINVA